MKRETPGIEAPSSLLRWLPLAWALVVLWAGACVALPALLGPGAPGESWTGVRRAWEMLGFPAGLDGVLGFRPKGVDAVIAAGAVAGVFLLLCVVTHWSLMRPARAPWTAALAGLHVTLICCGLGVAVMRSGGPPFNQSASQGAAYQLAMTQITQARAAVEQYRVDHGNRFPPLDSLWTSLTQASDADGRPLPTQATKPLASLDELAEDLALAASGKETGAGSGFGPYLASPPLNPYTRDASVQADNSASWQYDEGTGLVRIVLSPSQLPGFSNRDAAVAPHERQMGALKAQDPVSRVLGWTWKLSSGQIGWAGLQLMSAAAGALWVLWYTVFRWLLGGAEGSRAGARVALVMVAAAAVLAYMATGFLLDDVSRQTCVVLFLAAGLWATGGLALFPGENQRTLKRGRLCPRCGEGVAATLASGDRYCPSCGHDLQTTGRPSLGIAAMR